ncbi:MAG: hypothetical protein WA125_09545 [Desulfosporosinus sp.]
MVNVPYINIKFEKYELERQKAAAQRFSTTWFSRHLEDDACGWDTSQTLKTLMRQAKLGTSCKVKVLVG